MAPPPTGAPVQDVGPAGDVEDAAWTPRPWGLAPAGAGREAPIVVYEPITVRTLPPPATGARPLPPPDYLAE